METVHPLISFIIPAYNAEKTIKKCIESILRIANCKLEVIVVDDGSEDATVAVCNGIEDERIRIISKENSGVSSARNIGIKESNGKFLMFVDSDDSICTEEMQEVILGIESDDELIMFSSLRKYNDTFEKREPPLKPGIYGKEGLVFLKKSLLDVPLYKKWENNYFQGSAWWYLFERKRLIEKEIYFNESLAYSEDLCFCLLAYQNYTKIKVIDRYVYIVNVIIGSASRRYREHFWEELQCVYSEIVSITGAQRENLYYHYGKSAINHYLLYCNLKDCRKKIEIIICDKKFLDALKKISFKNRTWNEQIDDFLFAHHATLLLICYKKIYFKIMKSGSQIKQILRKKFARRK